MTPKRQMDPGSRRHEALRNLASAHEALDRASQRLAGVRRPLEPTVLAAGFGAPDGGERE